MFRHILFVYAKFLWGECRQRNKWRREEREKTQVERRRKEVKRKWVGKIRGWRKERDGGRLVERRFICGVSSVFVFLGCEFLASVLCVACQILMTQLGIRNTRTKWHHLSFLFLALWTLWLPVGSCKSDQKCNKEIKLTTHKLLLMVEWNCKRKKFNAAVCNMGERAGGLQIKLKCENGGPSKWIFRMRGQGRDITFGRMLCKQTCRAYYVPGTVLSVSHINWLTSSHLFSLKAGNLMLKTRDISGDAQDEGFPCLFFVSLWVISLGSRGFS